MIDASGTITANDGNYVVVRMDETGCGRCQEEGGCGGNNIGQMLCSSPRTFRVFNPGQAEIGDRITVVIADGSIRRSALLAYVVPLLALFAGAFGGSSLAGEIGAIVGAISGLFCAWITLRHAQKKSKPNQGALPYIKY